jgi:hypothetical protein
MPKTALPHVAFLAATLALAGCTNAARPTVPPAPPADCGAAALQGSIGQRVTGTTAADVRVGGVPVQSQGLVRVIAPGQAVTQDYRENRLNLETDASGNLVRANCA